MPVVNGNWAKTNAAVITLLGALVIFLGGLVYASSGEKKATVRQMYDVKASIEADFATRCKEERQERDSRFAALESKLDSIAASQQTMLVQITEVRTRLDAAIKSQ